MATIASVLERKCFLEWGEITFFPNMYIILVGPSGARKGTAMNVAARMLREIGKTKMAAEATTREALIRALKEAEEQDVDPTTGEVSYHASLTIFSEELTVFLGYHNLDLISDLNNWYDCRDHWTYRTKNMGTDDILGVWVNLMGATTPDLIRSALPLDAIGGGFSSRVIFVYEEKKGKTVADPFLTENDLELRNRLINDLNRIHALKGRFKITEEMLSKWVAWYTYQDENPPFTDPAFQGYVGRRATHLLKMCMILCASCRHDMLITGDIFDRAVGLLEATENKMIKTFSGMGKSPRSEVVNSVMETIALEGTIEVKELLRRHIADVQDMKEFSAIIATLKKVGYVHHDTSNDTISYKEGR